MIIAAAAAVAIALLLGRPRMVPAQIVGAEVKFHTDRIPDTEKQYLEGLDRKLETLIDDYQWTDEKYRYELPLRIDLYFNNWSWSAAYHRYNAGVLVALRSGIQLRDKRWDFRYARDEALHFGEPYDPLTGLIEFYIWICLGFEADRYSLLGGQPFYEKARFIAQNARFEMEYYQGWDQRLDFIHDLAGDTYRDLRTAAFHVEAGLYYLKNDKIESARSHLVRAVELVTSGPMERLELHRDDHIIRFVDLDRLVDGLLGIEAQDQTEKLARWDPDHKERYK